MTFNAVRGVSVSPSPFFYGASSAVVIAHIDFQKLLNG